MPNLIQALYRNVFQPLLFSCDAESAHKVAVKALQKTEKLPLAADLLRKSLNVDDPRLQVSIRSLNCPNPVGLAAGFDKGAELLNILPAFGFGFVEVGTLTPLMQSGQERPRLFRFKNQKALVNRMGFNNPGVKAAEQRLKDRKRRWPVPIGVNIGKGRDTALEEAVEDYAVAFDVVIPYADYVVLNVSSPNTPNLRDLQALKPMRTILTRLAERNRAYSDKTGEPPKLLFVKVSPDNDDGTLEEIARACVELNIGLVATNTTVDQSSLGEQAGKEKGGLSGQPLRGKSTYAIKKIYGLTKGVVPIIGVGGIFTAEDAYEKIRAGASLVQVYTGWIYEGPGLVNKINKGLLRLIEKDGFKNIQEAVGSL